MSTIKMKLMKTNEINFFIKNLPEPTLLVNSKGTIEAINTKAIHLLKHKKEALVGGSLAQCSSLTSNQVLKIIRMGQRSRQLIALNIPFIDNSGTPLRLSASGFLFFVSNTHESKHLMIRLKSKDSTTSKFMELNTKIKNQHKHLRLLNKSKEELEKVTRELNRYVKIVDKYIITATIDTHGIIVRASEAFCKISQYSCDELVGRPHARVKHPDTPQEIYKSIWRSVKNGEYWHGELKNLAKDGSSYYLDVHIEPEYNQNGTLLGYTAIKQDITDKKYIKELSEHDALTGLSNRLKLDRVITYQIEQSLRSIGTFSIILLDIDFFKRVNDTYGHLIGDRVLIELANILTSRGRTTDTIGRWGGEEFLIISPQTTPNGALTFAENLREAIETYPFSEVGDLTCSCGVATYQPKENYQTLLKRADTALYQAKALGRNQVQSL